MNPLRLLLGGLLLTIATATAAMEALSEQDLQQVHGQAGVAVDLVFRMNADLQGAPLPVIRQGSRLFTGADGHACSGNGNPCTLALQFNQREEWLVLKDLYGVMELSGLMLDGTFLPSEAGLHADPSRFLNAQGQCMTGQGDAGTCHASGLPALSLGFAGSPEHFEDDIRWRLHVGRVAVHDNAGGVQGYQPQADSGNTFMGLRMDDRVTGTGARIDVDGRILMFGF